MTNDSPQQFVATQRAFDSVAVDYDGALGNNALIQKMRTRVMDKIERTFPPGARLLDLGCGTGIDAAYLAARDYNITALDASPAMVASTDERLRRDGLVARTLNLGIHELAQLDSTAFDGAYSNFGALNCLPELHSVSAVLAGKLKPGGILIASVIGRYCPWELIIYGLRGNWKRARVRLTRGMVAVPLNSQTIWTHYYSPREFAREFAEKFESMDVSALALFAPPPYLIHWYEKFPRIVDFLFKVDATLGDKPFFRNAGDHFLIVLRNK